MSASGNFAKLLACLGRVGAILWDHDLILTLVHSHPFSYSLFFILLALLLWVELCDISLQALLAKVLTQESEGLCSMFAVCHLRMAVIFFTTWFTWAHPERRCFR